MPVSPLFAVLDWPMGTRSGFYAFINEKVNAQLKKVLNQWAVFLKSQDSAAVVTTQDHGWLSPTALERLQEAARETRPFEEIYVCDPTKPNWGFTSWDHFFTRKFRDGVRPLPPEDPTIIVNACESAPYSYPTKNVQEMDIFWIKRQP